MLVGHIPYGGPARTNLVMRMTNNFTNQAGVGAAIASTPKPTTTEDYMAFSGTQYIRYSDRVEWRVAAPYSIELEVFAVDAVTRWIGTEGEGFGAGWPEWNMLQSGGNFTFSTSSTNNSYDFTETFVTGYALNQWYRLGLMFYKVGEQMKVRGYVNDVKVFERDMLQPYDTANALAFGGDATGRADRMFKGRLRNITMAQSLFWTI